MSSFSNFQIGSSSNIQMYLFSNQPHAPGADGKLCEPERTATCAEKRLKEALFAR